MILPHLSYSYKKEVETQDRSAPKQKFDDLIIGKNKLMQIFTRARNIRRCFRGTGASPSRNLQRQALRSKEIFNKKSGLSRLHLSPSSSNSKTDTKRSQEGREL